MKTSWAVAREGGLVDAVVAMGCVDGGECADQEIVDVASRVMMCIFSVKPRWAISNLLRFNRFEKCPNANRYVSY